MELDAEVLLLSIAPAPPFLGDRLDLLTDASI